MIPVGQTFAIPETGGYDHEFTILVAHGERWWTPLRSDPPPSHRE